MQDKTQTIEVLKQARRKDKEHFARLVEEKEKEGEDKLQQEAAEYEDCLRKQLDRIDTLIQDKVSTLVTLTDVSISHWIYVG